VSRDRDAAVLQAVRAKLHTHLRRGGCRTRVPFLSLVVLRLCSEVVRKCTHMTVRTPLTKPSELVDTYICLGAASPAAQDGP